MRARILVRAIALELALCDLKSNLLCFYFLLKYQVSYQLVRYYGQKRDITVLFLPDLAKK